MYIVRYSEIGLKGRKARSSMERLLVDNLTKRLRSAGINSKIKKESGRILVYPEVEGKDAEDSLGNVAGVKSFSQCKEYRAVNLQEIVDIVREDYWEKVRGKTIAVRSRRTGNQDFTSMDMDREIGSALYDHSAGVDLEDPDLEIGVEIRDTQLFVFDRIIKGPGGLPLGSQGKLISLMSGGIDSPVATWMMMKRGSPCDIVFCSLAHPVDTLAFLGSADKLLRKWSAGYDPVIHIIDGRALIEALSDNSKFHFQNVEFKRVLYLIADVIAGEYGIHGIVTGESLGQVSSQTAENLNALSHGLEIPVFRPLIGLDKDEIVEIARRIGTLPDADLGEFCSLFADRPITRITSAKLDDDMKGLSIISNLVSSKVSFHYSDIDTYRSSLTGSASSANGITPNSIVIDLRSLSSYESWHYPGAINAGLNSIEDLVSKYGKEKVYIIYCKKGLQSAYAASKIKSLGGNAFYSSEESIRKISGTTLTG